MLTNLLAHRWTWFSSVIVLVVAGNCAADDVIEFLSGAKAEGQVTKIDKDEKQISFEAKISGRTFTRVYPYSKIHAVTYRGQRYILNEKTDSDTPAAPTVSSTGGGSSPSPATGVGLRSRPQVEALIKQEGSTPPDWYDTTPLDHPQSLDLSWPEPAPKGWDNQKNVGQYVWDVINPNTGRWPSGIRFMHHMLSLHKNDARLRERIMRELGNMYFRFFQDYARAAFWWQQTGINKGDNDSILLAECYFRLGNRQMAETLIIDPDRDRGGTLMPGMIKLWGDMGEPNKAIKLADWYVKVGGEPHMAYLFAGDAFRVAGRYNEAMKYYQKVIDTPAPDKKGRVDQTIRRAQDNLQAIKLFELCDVSKVADGRYRASSQGYEGPIEVEVQVAAGRIEAVRVTQHKEKQFYSALTDVPDQIIKKQGVKGVDATSRATITAEAIINSAAKALASGAR